MKTTFTRIHKFLVGLIGISVFVQMFLAGIWHAGVVQTPEAHVFLGLGILLAALLALIAALLARLPRPAVAATAVLFILILLQPILIEQRHNGGVAFLSAFHTLNAAIIGFMSGAVMRVTTVATARQQAETAVPAASAAD